MDNDLFLNKLRELADIEPTTNGINSAVRITQIHWQPQACVDCERMLDRPRHRELRNLGGELIDVCRNCSRALDPRYNTYTYPSKQAYALVNMKRRRRERG